MIHRGRSRPSPLAQPLPSRHRADDKLSGRGGPRVLLEDQYLIAVDKPAGMPVGGDDDAEGVVGEAIRRRSAGRIEARGPVWRTVYRLDRGSSGVLLLSKTRGAGAALGELYSGGQMRQEFVGRVAGRPRKRRMRLSPAEARRAGANANSAREKRADDRDKTVVVEMIESADRDVLVRYSGERLKPVHVRLHLGSVGLPVVGDLHLARVSFVHPFTGRRVSLVSPMPARFEPQDRLRLERETADRRRSAATVRNSDERARPRSEPGAERRALEAALRARAELLRDERTTAFRLLNGSADGAAGLVAEQFNDVLILQDFGTERAPDSERLRSIAQWYIERLNLRSVYAKHFVKGRSHVAEGADPRLYDPTPLVGEPAAPEIAILENGLRFIVRPYDGYSVGLFLDQRDNRRRVRELAAGRRVLNLFAYTCGFSVAAAAGGAAETVSIDLSKRHLEWGRQNFAANDIDPERHVFLRADASGYLERAARNERSFDLIILDPPTFARMKKPRRTFTITTGLKPLLEQAMAVLSPGGHMLVSTNARELSVRWLQAQLAEAAADRPLQVIDVPPLPPDFAGDPDFAKSAIVRFDG